MTFWVQQNEQTNHFIYSVHEHQSSSCSSALLKLSQKPTPLLQLRCLPVMPSCSPPWPFALRLKPTATAPLLHRIHHQPPHIKTGNLQRLDGRVSEVSTLSELDSAISTEQGRLIGDAWAVPPPHQNVSIPRRLSSV